MKNLIGLSAFAVLAVQALPAQAQSPASLGGSGQAKVSTSQQPVTVKERTDNEVERKKKQGKSQRELREEKGGGLSRSDFETAAIEKDLSSALDNEIRYMEPLVAKLRPNSEQRPEIMRRLIESLHQQSLLAFFKESRQYDETWNKWDQGGRRGAEPRLTGTKSKIATSKVIQRCQQFIVEYPKGKGIDEVTFQLAYAFDQLGQNKEAAQYYSRLVANYPNSKRVADAHFALGEYHFGRLDFPKALTSFTEVVRYTRAPIRPWAEFKIAWCLYNLQKYQQALERWQLVVNLANTSNTTAKGARLKMKDEALRDMLLAYVELGQVKEAMDYMTRNANEKNMGDLFNKLAGLVQDKGEYDKAVVVLKTYIAMKPNDFRSAELQIQIADTANLKNDKTLLWLEIIALNKNYGPDSSWAKVNANNPDFKETQEKIHNVSYTYAKKMHFLGQKEKQQYYLEQAIKGYKIYLATYPNRKETNEIRFLLGELQYLRDQFRDAGKTFASFTAKKEFRTADPQRYEKAFDYQRTSAYFVIQKEMAGLRSQRFNAAQPSRSLSPDVQEYVTVCDSYASLFPKKQGTLDCQVDTAEIFLKTNNIPQAEKRLMVLAKERAGQKEGAAAAEFLLLLSKDDKKKLISTTDSLLQIPQYKGGELGKRLSLIKSANRFDELKELESGGKFEQAAQEFERLAADRAYNKADAALFNAGVNYKRANRLDKATAAYQRVINEHPKSELVDDAMLEIIDLTSGRLQLQTAVSYVRMFLTRYPTNPKSPKLMAGACAYYEALSQAERAREVCPQVIKAGGPAAAVAAESMAGVLERAGRYQEFWSFAEKDLLRFSKTTTEKIEVWNRIAEAAKKAGNGGKVASAQQQIMKLYNADKGSVSAGPPLSYVGAIRFAQEFPSLEKFRREVLVGGKSGAEFQQNIIKRNAELKKLTDKFTGIVQSVGDAEWSVASLYVVGYAHELVAAELLNPPQPPGITGEGWQKVKATLAGLGVQLQKKAKDYYQSGGDIVAKFNVYTDYGQKVLSALARLEPTKYRKSEEWIPNVMFVGTEVIDSAKYKSVLDPKGF